MLRLVVMRDKATHHKTAGTLGIDTLGKSDTTSLRSIDEYS